jgi:hypothetical protein
MTHGAWLILASLCRALHQGLPHVRNLAFRRSNA